MWEQSIQRLSPDEIRKYLDYLFQEKSFQPDLTEQAVALPLAQAALQIRGPARKPAIMVHGIMPRSGTVYVTQLLRLHPDLFAFPYDWFEVPFLQLSADILKLQRQFLVNHRHNREKLGDTDFLTLFGSALVAYLHAVVPAEKRLLVKVPSVEYLHYFWCMYPYEHLLLVIRDGRDVVESTVKTWPQIRFSFACRRWRRAAHMVRKFDEHFRGRQDGYCLARFEDAVTDPERFVREACRHFGLDESRYPYEEMRQEIRKVRGSSHVTSSGEVVWEEQERPKDFRPMGYWKSWPWHKKWLFKRLAGSALVDLGYSPDLSW